MSQVKTLRAFVLSACGVALVLLNFRANTLHKRHMANKLYSSVSCPSKAKLAEKLSNAAH